MVKRHFGTLNVPPKLRSSYAAIDVQPNDDVREDIPGFTTDLPNGLTVNVQWHTLAQARRHPVNKDNILSVEMACFVRASTSHNGKTRWMTGSVWPELSGGYDTMSFIPVADVVQLIDDARRWNIDKLHDQIRAVKEDIAANDKRISSLKKDIAAITKPYSK